MDLAREEWKICNHARNYRMDMPRFVAILSMKGKPRMNADEFKAIGKALQVAANGAAATLAACEAAGISPTKRKKPGRKKKAEEEDERPATKAKRRKRTRPADDDDGDQDE